MGNYVVVADVQALINVTQFEIDDSSIPSETVVEGWIDDIEAEIDALLYKCGATVPVSDSRDIARLKRYVSEKVAAMVWNTAFTDIEEPDFVAEWRKRYDAILTQMQSCSYVLYGQSIGGISVTRMRVMPAEDD